MANFSIAYNRTLGHEGVYSNDPVDRGGETYKGIARKKHPKWNGWAIVDQLKRDKIPASQWSRKLEDLVFMFYRVHFWDELACDRITDQNIANELFDTAVNMGTVIAGRILQDSVNLLGGSLVVDGKIGPATISAVNGHRFKNDIFKLMNIQQGARYVEIAKDDPKQTRFLRGWMTRVTFN